MTSPQPTTAWFARSVDQSLRQALLVAVAVWQAVMVWAVLTTDDIDPGRRWGVVGAHLVVATLVVPVRRGRLPFWTLLVILHCLWLADLWITPTFDGALLLACCWMGNLVYLTGAALLGRVAGSVTPVAGGAVVGVAIAVLRDDWLPANSGAYVVTAVAIVVAVRLGLPVLDRLAASADAEAERAAAERREALAARRAGLEAAEDARVMHDTIINTLGAVANGAATATPADAIRERCAADATRIRALLEGRDDVTVGELAVVGGSEGSVTVHRHGLGEDDLTRQEALLDPRVVRAISGAAREAVRNAARHAGVDSVVVETSRVGDDLVLVIQDDGVGFDGRPVPGRGLQTSVIDRIVEVGGRVVVTSAPGAGTRVRIVCPIGGGAATADPAPDATDHDAVVGNLLHRACWTWTAGVVGVGVAIEAVNRAGRLTATYAMLLIVALSGLVSWAVLRRRASLPVTVRTLLVVALCGGFVVGLAGVDYGREDVLYYQAIGITPIIAILVVTRSRPRFLTALGALAVTALAVAVVLATRTSADGAVVVVAVAPALGVGVGWWGFAALVDRVVADIAADRRRELAARVDAATRRAVLVSRRRWRVAGLRTSLELLDDLASGRVEPGDAAVRRRSGDEEQYLRQLTLLSPDAPRMGTWFARALADARSRGVSLTVHSGDVDAPDDAVARAMGAVALAAVARAPAAGSLVVSLFPGPALIVVGSLAIVGASAEVPLPGGWTSGETTTGVQHVVEIVVDATTATGR